MKNVFDIRYEKQLTYILSPDKEKACSDFNDISNNVAIILYFYYEDTLQGYYRYINNIPKEVDIYFVSSRECVLAALKKDFDNRKATYILKKNVGRDISALLVTCKEIISKYKYVCFLHDKKAKFSEKEMETELWVENLWGNLLCSDNYIRKIICLFEHNQMLGVLAPPDPIGDNFVDWYGGGWEGSFSITQKLAQMLDLNADISEDKPPISLGTAFWFRTDAIKKIFKHSWKYADFDDTKLDKADYISYAVERIFPYVAQDAGYDTGEIMNVVYATKQMNYLKHAIPLVFADQIKESPMLKLADKRKEEERLRLLLDFCKEADEIYLYGLGKMGRYIWEKMSKTNIRIAGFLQSYESENDFVCNVPVYTVENVVKKNPNVCVIVTPYEKYVRKEIMETLISYGVKRVHEFWEN